MPELFSKAEHPQESKSVGLCMARSEALKTLWYDDAVLHNEFCAWLHHAQDGEHGLIPTGE